MPFPTPGQVFALTVVLLGGWLIGYACAPSPRKWQRRVREQSRSFTTRYRTLEARLAAAERRADLAERSGAVAAMPPVAQPAPIGPVTPGAGRVAGDARDDLTRLRGIDGVLDARLSALGVTRFEDLETLSAEDEMALEQRLALPVGLVTREQWRTQAALLRAGQVGEHAAHFGASGQAPAG